MLAVDSDNTLQATVIAEINDIAIFVRFVVALILVVHIRSVLLVYIGTRTIRQDQPGCSRSVGYFLIEITFKCFLAFCSPKLFV